MADPAEGCDPPGRGGQSVRGDGPEGTRRDQTPKDFGRDFALRAGDEHQRPAAPGGARLMGATLASHAEDKRREAAEGAGAAAASSDVKVSPMLRHFDDVGAGEGGSIGGGPEKRARIIRSRPALSNPPKPDATQSQYFPEPLAGPSSGPAHDLNAGAARLDEGEENLERDVLAAYASVLAHSC